jgi:hypothetical protein
MGSGISLSREQIIQIIKNTIKDEFELKERNNPKKSDDGYLLYDTFDDEEVFNKKIRYLDSLLRKYSQE